MSLRAGVARGVLPVIVALAAMNLFAARPARADFICGFGDRIRWFEVPGSLPADVNCVGLRCYEPEPGTPVSELVSPSCDPKVEPCAVRLRIPWAFRGVAQTFEDEGVGVGQIFWFAGATSPPCNGTSPPNCGQIGVCANITQSIIYDFVDTYVLRGDVTCDNAAFEEVFSLTAWTCVTNSTCRQERKLEGLVLGGPSLAAAIGCPPPPPPSRCPDDESSCSLCTGPMSASSPGGQGPGFGPAKSGPGAQLHYAASGAGFPTRPGAAAWAATLGRGWSHDHAERIVIDPDDSHVWLITKYATFREFSGLSGGVYNTVSRATRSASSPARAPAGSSAS